MIWNFDDLVGAWSWLSPSSLKSMYQNFNWRFWKDDGMRNEDDKETDPHYREMLKVINLRAYFAWYLLMSNFVTVPRCPEQLVLGDSFHFYSHVTCHYLQDGFDFAMVNSPHSRICCILISTLQVGFLDFSPSGGGIYSFLRGPVCHYRISLHYPTVYSGKIIDSGRLFHRSAEIQMIGGFIHPGKPMANMYFVLYGYSMSHTFLWVSNFQSQDAFFRLCQSGPTIAARSEDRSM